MGKESKKEWICIHTHTHTCAHTHTYIHNMYNWLCQTPCDPMGYSLPGSSVHGISQTRMLKSSLMVQRVKKLPECRRHRRYGFNSWVRKIPWRRARQPTPVFLPGESRGQRSLAGYSPQCCRVRHDWLANTFPFSRGSSTPRDQIPVSCIAGRFSTVWSTHHCLSTILKEKFRKEAHILLNWNLNISI